MQQGQMSVGLGLFLFAAVTIPVIGAIVGWIAGMIMAGHGFGFWTNAGLGMLGSILGSYALGIVGFHFLGIIGVMIKATVGAVVVLAVAQWFRKRQAG